MPKFPPLEKDPFDTDDEIQRFGKVSGQSVTAQGRQQLLARDHSFDDALFINQAKATFMTLQKARADRNLESFRTQLTELMYKQWQARTDALSTRHRRTLLTRLDIDSATIARILVEPDADIITVEFEGTRRHRRLVRPSRADANRYPSSRWLHRILDLRPTSAEPKLAPRRGGRTG